MGIATTKKKSEREIGGRIRSRKKVEIDREREIEIVRERER